MHVVDNQKIKQAESEDSQPEFQDIWNIYTFQGGRRFDFEKISDAVLIFVTNGNLEISIGGNVHLIVCTEEMLIIPANVSFSLRTLANVQFMSCMVDEQSSLLKQLVIHDLSLSVDLLQDQYIKLPVKKQICNFLQLLKHTISDGLNSAYYLGMKRNELFLLFFVYYTKEELTYFLSKLSPKDFQFKRFIMENYLSVRNVGELAEKTNYSISGFIKKFNSNFGESPYKWIQKQKAKQIYFDITDRKKTLKEIVNDYHFSSYQHFAKFCKTHLGSPPTASFFKNINNIKNENN